MDEVKAKWPFVIALYDSIYINDLSLGNYTQYRVVAFKTRRPHLSSFFIAIEGRGNYLFPTDRPLHWQYVAEKLSIGPADAKNMSDFINMQIMQECGQQGSYYEDLLNPHYKPTQSPFPWEPCKVEEKKNNQ